jgi:hypothetical protein
VEKKVQEESFVFSSQNTSSLHLIDCHLFVVQDVLSPYMFPIFQYVMNDYRWVVKERNVQEEICLLHVKEKLFMPKRLSFLYCTRSHLFLIFCLFSIYHKWLLLSCNGGRITRVKLSSPHENTKLFTPKWLSFSDVQEVISSSYFPISSMSHVIIA